MFHLSVDAKIGSSKCDIGRQTSFTRFFDGLAALDAALPSIRERDPTRQEMLD